MNSRVHSEMLATPFTLMFGRGPFNHACPDKDDEKLLQEDRDKMDKFWRVHKDSVSNMIYKMRVTNFEKDTYHKKTSIYKPGDIVMLRNPTKKK
ncbi:hypothetical protein AKO1_001373, partial [Acrasis kona]